MEKKHDKWIFGESFDGWRRYITHTQSPRFIGEVFDDFDSWNFDCQLNNGQLLANIVWIDAEPAPGPAKVSLFKEASDAMDKYDAALAEWASEGEKETGLSFFQQ